MYFKPEFSESSTSSENKNIMAHDYSYHDNLNYDELEYNWELVVLKSANLNQPYWNTLYYFRKYANFCKHKVAKFSIFL